MSANGKAGLFGVDFDVLTRAQAAEKLLGWIGEDNAPKTVITVNVAILMMMRADPELRKAVENADLVVADGMPLVWAAKWMATPLPERVTGVDVMESTLSACGERKLRAYFLGTTPERLERLLQVVRRANPGIEIVGAKDGYFDRSRSDEVIAEINTSNADILYVGMPAPFKEIWCERHRDALGAKIILGVGGAFDVLAGFVPRAPLALQNAGCEWAWRLAQEPRKLWKRYLFTNSQFALLLGRELTNELFRRRPGMRLRSRT